MTEAVRAMEIPAADQRSRGFSAFQTRMKSGALDAALCDKVCVVRVARIGGMECDLRLEGLCDVVPWGDARARRAVASFSGDDSMLVQGAASSAHSKTSARDRLRREVRKTTS